jgi:hypothetical protein
VFLKGYLIKLKEFEPFFFTGITIVQDLERQGEIAKILASITCEERERV